MAHAIYDTGQLLNPWSSADSKMGYNNCICMTDPSLTSLARKDKRDCTIKLEITSVDGITFYTNNLPSTFDPVLIGSIPFTADLIFCAISAPILRNRTRLAQLCLCTSKDRESKKACSCQLFPCFCYCGNRYSSKIPNKYDLYTVFKFFHLFEQSEMVISEMEQNNDVSRQVIDFLLDNGKSIESKVKIILKEKTNHPIIAYVPVQREIGIYLFNLSTILLEKSRDIEKGIVRLSDIKVLLSLS